MAGLDDKTLRKLAKLIPVLGSSHAGEVAAAGAAIVRTLDARGASLHDLVKRLTCAPRERVVYREKIVVQERIVYRDPPPAPKPASGIDVGEVVVLAPALLAWNGLAENERAFVENMHRRAVISASAFTMTARQAVWFYDLVSKQLAEERGRGHLSEPAGSDAGEEG